ncbi:AAA domain-containing protein [Anaerolineales bacterium HSG6]|nr:AAA domain-containing protein [Anaerolineales bacterium HSG6]
MTTLTKLYQQLNLAFSLEIVTQRKKSGLIQARIESLDLIASTPEGHFYQIELDKELHLHADQPITLISGRSKKEVNGTVIKVEQYTVLLFTQEPFEPEQSYYSRLSFDPTFILQALREVLVQKEWLSESLSQQLLTHSLPKLPTQPTPPSVSDKLSLRQKVAIQRSLADPIHLIWGPPGTGKTSTLGQLVAQHLRLGHSCLLLSISNVAVDQLVQSVLKQVEPHTRQQIVRLGFPLDEQVKAVTPKAQLLQELPDLRRKLDKQKNFRQAIEKNLTKYRAQLAEQPTVSRQTNSLIKGIGENFAQLQRINAEIEQYETQLQAKMGDIVEKGRCIATTLASLALQESLHLRKFDVVIVDEISMVSLPYILAAASRTQKQLTLAGDPQQLPPIYQDMGEIPKRWFGRNAYQHLGITDPDNHPNVTFLNKQYRMQAPIASIVSQLSYGNKLETETTPHPEASITVLDLQAWLPQTYKTGSYYSVAYKSYYSPLSVLLTAHLVEVLPALKQYPTLLLSPFRAQEKLLGKLTEDLPFAETSRSSTIHKAQGSEQDIVILDLTIHDPQSRQKFFDNVETAQKLLNVALSRSRLKLIILCNLELLTQLSQTEPYYGRFREQLLPYLKTSQTIKRQVNEQMTPYSNICRLLSYIPPLKHGFYSSLPMDDKRRIAEVAQKLQAKTKEQAVIVTRSQKTISQTVSGVVWRTEGLSSTPPLAIFDTLISCHAPQGWVNHPYLPKTAFTLKRICAGHLLDREIDVQKDTHHLLCPRCQGYLQLARTSYGLIMRCPNTDCPYTRSVREMDARWLVQLHEITCPTCHTPMKPRRSGRDNEIFLGCSNYPRCKKTRNLRYFVG